MKPGQKLRLKKRLESVNLRPSMRQIERSTKPKKLRKIKPGKKRRLGGSENVKSNA